jgi:CRP-like cAMP-binding protein
MSNKIKILVIEDNLDIRENIAELLELSGYSTIQAENGKVGVKRALEELPDLILCDIMMPELDGYGVLHILGKHEETLHIPFIFLTAKAEKTDVRKGMTLGADDYITKPFEETDLLSAIENRLKKFSNLSAVASSSNFDVIFESKAVKKYATKDIIFREGDTPSYVYFLKKGKVKIVKLSDTGKEAVLELCNSGDFFGYWSVLEEKDQSETAEVIEDSEVWLIPIETFLKQLNTNVEVSGKFLKMLSKNLLIKQSKILELAYESVRKRVANALIAMCDIYGEDKHLSMKIPRELVASMAGTSVETAIRMLSEFKGDKLIDINKGEITILDYQKLKTSPF